MFPTVSVIIPAYNQAQFLRQAINSVLAQTFTDYEIIVINDGSTDETQAIMAEYDDQIRTIHQKNKGLSGARNSGLKIARGEFIAFLDSDDEWYPDMLANTVSFLRNNFAYDLVAGNWDLIDEAGYITRGPQDLTVSRMRLERDFLCTIAVGNFVIPSTIVVRRACFECCGNFDETLRGVEDWDILIRFAAHSHQMALIDVPVLHYRRHPGCLTRDPQRTEQASRQAIEKLYSDRSLLAKLAAELKQHAYVYAWLSIAGYAHEAGLETDVQRLLKEAKQHYQAAPTNNELGLEYLNRLSILPETDAFMFLIAKSAPETYPLYLWLMAKKGLRKGMYDDAVRYLTKLFFTQPRWLIQKIQRGFQHRFHRLKVSAG